MEYVQNGEKVKKLAKKISSVLLIIMLIVFSNCLVYAAVTQVDLTGLATGSDVNHQHVYVDSFDDTYHYKRCFICGGVINKAAHTKVDNWYSSDLPRCHYQNHCTTTCTANCGYSKVWRDPCTKMPADYPWGTSIGSGWVHFKPCAVCGGASWPEYGACVKADGSRITCTNLGVCSICGYNYTLKEHSIRGTNGVCTLCGTKCFDASIISESWGTGRASHTLTIRLVPNISLSIGDVHSGQQGVGVTMTGGTYTANSNGTFDLTYYNSFAESTFAVGSTWIRPGTTVVIDGVNCYFYYPDYYVSPDNVRPTISGVTQTNITTSGAWCTSKKITISGTEDHSDIVYIKMTKTDGTVLYPYSGTSVSSHNYSFSFIPEFEASSPTNFYLYVKDNAGNEASYTITVEKIDYKAPTLVSSSNYLSPWRQNQLVTFQVKDEGIGQVQFAFNNTNDYQAATYNSSNGCYERQYNFYGNVPIQVTGALYVKDGLGNQKMYKINFNKLDNTKPTISASNKTYGDSVTATIGDTYAGVAGHQITSSNSQPSTWIADSSESSKNVSFGIKNAGTWYIWVKDGAGNVNSASISVSKRSITITANNQTTYYPTRITKTAAYATSSYLPSGQSISAITLTDNPGGTSFPTPNANGIGTGTITPSAATITSTTDGNVTSNYTITYANGTWTVKDNTKPTGRIKITNPVILRDGRQAVGRTATNVTITAADDYAKVKEIYLFNENNITTPVGNIPASSWINWDSSTSLTNIGTNTKTMNWTLSNGDGAKTVYLYIRDRAGNVTITF